MNIIPSPAQTMPPASVCLDALHYFGYTVEIIPPLANRDDVYEITATGHFPGCPDHIAAKHADLHHALWFAARQLGDDWFGRYLASLTPGQNPDGGEVHELLTLIRDVLDLPKPAIGHFDAYQRLLLLRASAIRGLADALLSLGDDRLIPLSRHVEMARQNIAEQYPVTYPVLAAASDPVEGRVA